ncbi:DUF6913 domain-containing protein [Altibacter sp. HG106]|uniref:DUF6913 domain-containing protein n=1 Tax=Altibacter sp. HG106 TaxID=3023937 RepID=UPI003FA45390
MFDSLKRKAIQRQTRQLLEKRDTSHINDPLKTLGFLVHEGMFNELETLQESWQFFELQPKDVKVFSFLEVKKSAPSLRSNQMTNKDVSWKGVISNVNAVEFLDRPFDVLVGYYAGTQPMLDLMMSRSKAKFKVGCKGGTPGIYDLLLDIAPEQNALFLEELKKYMIVLNKL